MQVVGKQFDTEKHTCYDACSFAWTNHKASDCIGDEERLRAADESVGKAFSYGALFCYHFKLFTY